MILAIVFFTSFQFNFSNIFGIGLFSASSKYNKLLYNLKSASGLRSEGLKCLTDAGSAGMSTVIVAVVTVRSGMLSISADGIQFRHAVVNYLRI